MDIILRPKIIKQKLVNRPPIITPVHPIVYHGHAAHLGDCWLKMCRIINVSITTNSIVRFIESSNRHKEIISLLKPCLITNISRNEVPKGTKLVHTNELSNVYVPTRIRWSGSTRMNRICYQFDGKSSVRIKNPPEQDLPKLIDFIPGIDFVRLGNHLSLEKCVKIMASSDCFLGVDSGMSHIAHSVGVPCFIIKYRFDFTNWHVNAPPFITCYRTKDAINKVTHFMDNLRLEQ